MAYIADADTQARKLRAVESAAASAVGNGCDPEEVRRRVEIGIAEAVAMNNRRPGEPAPSTATATARPGALDDFTRSVR
jgi:hypothetical protein